MTNLPYWLKGKATAVAKALIADGFCYCGEESEYCICYENLEAVGDWLIGNWQYVIDAITDGALFSKDYNDSEDCDIDKEIERIQQLIAKVELDWDSCINEGQLSLF